jgi:hypothetical protein
MYTIRTPTLLMMTQTWSSVLPHQPKVSPMTPPYESAPTTPLNRTSSWMEASARSAASTMLTRPGTRPSTFMVAGSAMMPAPTIVVDRLKTAPGKEAPLNSWNAASSSPSAAAAEPSRFVGSSGSLGSAAPPMVIFEKNSGGFLWSTDYSFSFEKKKEEKEKQFFYKAWIFCISSLFLSYYKEEWGILMLLVRRTLHNLQGCRHRRPRPDQGRKNRKARISRNRTEIQRTKRRADD